METVAVVLAMIGVVNVVVLIGVAVGIHEVAAAGRSIRLELQWWRYERERYEKRTTPPGEVRVYDDDGSPD